MKIVARPVMRPFRCQIYSTIGATAQTGWIDTGAETSPPPLDDRVYVSTIAARDMAKLIGWHSPYEVEVLEGERDKAVQEKDALQARIDQLEAELREADLSLDAVQTLTRAGYKRRPRKSEEEANASN